MEASIRIQSNLTLTPVLSPQVRGPNVCPSSSPLPPLSPFRPCDSPSCATENHNTLVRLRTFCELLRCGIDGHHILPSLPPHPVMTSLSTWIIAANRWSTENTRIPLAAPLSAQDVVSCSPYSQGCNGGFEFLVGLSKLIAERNACPTHQSRCWHTTFWEGRCQKEKCRAPIHGNTRNTHTLIEHFCVPGGGGEWDWNDNVRKCDQGVPLGVFAARLFPPFQAATARSAGSPNCAALSTLPSLYLPPPPSCLSACLPTPAWRLSPLIPCCYSVSRCCSRSLGGERRVLRGSYRLL